jgi:hypothetical protein
LELRLLGVDVNGLQEFEERALRNVLTKNKLLEMYKLKTIVTAIFDVGDYIANGKSGGKVNDQFRKLRNLLFPQLDEDLREKAEKTQALLKREFDSGPFMVQGLDYKGGGSGKGRRR